SIEIKYLVTLTLALFDTEKRNIRFCGAVHLPILATINGTINMYKTYMIRVDLEQVIIIQQTLIEVEISLRVGEIYAFFSDGITEAMNEKNDLFGEEKLSEILKNKSSRRSSEIMDIVWNEIKTFRGKAPISDDMTMVLVKICER